MWFNDYWNGAYEKPAAFGQRLDEAEDCLNERLTATGEFWRLDTHTRAMLGLPLRQANLGRRVDIRKSVGLLESRGDEGA
jgi:hypothetical protein